MSAKIVTDWLHRIPRPDEPVQQNDDVASHRGHLTLLGNLLQPLNTCVPTSPRLAMVVFVEQTIMSGHGILLHAPPMQLHKIRPKLHATGGGHLEVRHLALG